MKTLRQRYSMHKELYQQSQKGTDMHGGYQELSINASLCPEHIV